MPALTWRCAAREEEQGLSASTQYDRLKCLPSAARLSRVLRRYWHTWRKTVKHAA